MTALYSLIRARLILHKFAQPGASVNSFVQKEHKSDKDPCKAEKQGARKK